MLPQHIQDAPLGAVERINPRLRQHPVENAGSRLLNAGNEKTSFGFHVNLLLYRIIIVNTMVPFPEPLLRQLNKNGRETMRFPSAACQTFFSISWR